MRPARKGSGPRRPEGTTPVPPSTERPAVGGAAISAVFICGPRIGRGGYAESVEHDMQHVRKRKFDEHCLFCDMDRHRDRYVFVDGGWRAR